MDVASAQRRQGWPVTVVVPTMNEETTLGAVLDAVRPHADELLVVDGHSTDATRTVAAARGARVLLDDGKGKGAAIRLALEVAANPLVVFIDADGSHEPADIPSLLAPLREGRAEIVIGSRMSGGSDELFSDLSEFVRLTGSMVINLAINYRWGVRLSDTQNGYRAVVREACQGLGLTSDSTTIEQEMVMKALAHGVRVMNVPSHEYRRRGGESKIIVARVWPAYVWNVLRHVLRPWPRPRPALGHRPVHALPRVEVPFPRSPEPGSLVEPP